MKKILLLANLLFSINAFSQIPNYVPTNGLVAWYPFTGNANDISGNNLNGTVTGAALTIDRFNNNNSAYNFSSTGQHIDFFSDSTWCSGDHTISFWFNSSYISGTEQFLLTKRGTCLGGAEIYFEARIKSTGNFIDIGWGGGTQGYFYNTPFTPNVWNHVVYEVSGSNELLYLNGSLIGQQAHNNPTNTVMLRAGNNSCSISNNDYTGKFDDLGLWSRALTQQEVTAIYSSSCIPVDISTGLIASYQFTGNANDVSGNGHNAITINANLTTDRFGNANSAYSFNGTSNYIDVNDATPLRLNNTDYTISFWTSINAYSTGGGTAFIYKRSAGSQNGWGLGADQGTQNKLGLITSEITDPRSYSTSTLSLSGWHNVTVVYTLSLNQIKFYVDGVLDNTTTGVDNNYNPVVGGMPTPSSTCSSVMRFGQDTKNNSYWLNGKLDDIRIYNRALTACDADSLFNLPNQCTGVTASITPQTATTFCQGGNVTLRASTGASYSWSNAQTTQNVTVTQGGNYTVTVSNSSNCTATASQSVTVNSNPTVTINANGPTTFCQGGNVTLTATSNNSYSWSNSQTSQSVTVNQTGNYTVTVANNNNCTASASQSVTVNPLPLVSFSLPGFINNQASSFTLNGSPSGGSYSGIGGVNGSTLNPSQAGLGNKLVTYTYTNGNNCTNTASASTIVYDTTGSICTTYDTLITHLSVTDTLVINVNLTGINPPNNTNLITVYPNPTHNYLEINCGNLSTMTGYSIKITNVLGQTVFNQLITQQQFNINLSTFGGNGTYILYILDAQQNIKSTKEIILQ